MISQVLLSSLGCLVGHAAVCSPPSSTAVPSTGSHRGQGGIAVSTSQLSMIFAGFSVVDRYFYFLGLQRGIAVCGTELL